MFYFDYFKSSSALLVARVTRRHSATARQYLVKALVLVLLACLSNFVYLNVLQESEQLINSKAHKMLKGVGLL